MSNQPNPPLPPAYKWLKYIGNDVIKLSGVGELEPGQIFQMEESKALQSLEARPDIFEATAAPGIIADGIETLLLPLETRAPVFPAEEPMALPDGVNFPPDASTALPAIDRRKRTAPDFPTSGTKTPSDSEDLGAPDNG